MLNPKGVVNNESAESRERRDFFFDNLLRDNHLVSRNIINGIGCDVDWRVDRIGSSGVYNRGCGAIAYRMDDLFFGSSTINREVDPTFGSCL